MSHFATEVAIDVAIFTAEHARPYEVSLNAHDAGHVPSDLHNCLLLEVSEMPGRSTVCVQKRFNVNAQAIFRM